MGYDQHPIAGRAGPIAPCSSVDLILCCSIGKFIGGRGTFLCCVLALLQISRSKKRGSNLSSGGMRSLSSSSFSRRASDTSIPPYFALVNMLNGKAFVPKSAVIGRALIV